MSSEFDTMTAAELARRIARREVSPVEVTRRALDKAEATQATLNAFVRLMPEQAMAAARDGHPSELAHERRADAASPHSRLDEEVLEPEARRGAKRRIALEEERVRADLPVDVGNQHIEAWPCAEGVLDQAPRRLVVRWGQLLEVGERAHEADEGGPIGPLGGADRECGHGLRTV